MKERLEKYGMVIYNNRNILMKDFLIVFAYTYIYFSIFYLIWKYSTKLSIVGLNIIDLFFILSATIIFIVTFIYKKNELYLIILLVLLFQFFV